MSRGQADTPPFKRDDLEKVRRMVIQAAGDLLRERIPNTGTFPVQQVNNLEKVFQALHTMLDANEQWREARRQASLAEVHHLVADPGDRAALCGVEGMGGWRYQEYVDRSVAAGANMCAECMAVHATLPPAAAPQWLTLG